MARGAAARSTEKAEGGERLAPANGIELAYEELGDPEGAPMVLIMGLAAQMIFWPDELCELLGRRGYRLIRFDNRDVGHSTMLDSAGIPTIRAMVLGTGKPAYRIRDMAADTIGLLDHLEIGRAHLVGADLGGMIAQQIAIDHPRRALSLCSIMSATGNRRHRLPRWRAFSALMSAPPRTREAAVEAAVETLKLVGSPRYPADEERFRDRVGRAFDRGHRPAGVARQLHAMNSSGNRTAKLRELDVPTLVIHGKDDPLIRAAAGRQTARVIPEARLVLIEGMGHDLPEALHERLAGEIDDNARRAER